MFQNSIQFGFKAKAIFCPLTSTKSYATLRPTKSNINMNCQYQIGKNDGEELPRRHFAL